MKYENKKRVKLILTIIGIMISFFLIIMFVHNPFFLVYFKSTLQDIPDFYKVRIYQLIADNDNMTDEVRKALWDLTASELKPDISNITNYILICYMIIGFLIMCITAILVKWYTSDNGNLIISDKKMSIEEYIEQLTKKGK